MKRAPPSSSPSSPFPGPRLNGAESATYHHHSVTVTATLEVVVPLTPHPSLARKPHAATVSCLPLGQTEGKGEKTYLANGVRELRENTVRLPIYFLVYLFAGLGASSRPTIATSPHLASPCPPPLETRSRSSLADAIPTLALTQASSPRSLVSHSPKSAAAHLSPWPSRCSPREDVEDIDSLTLMQISAAYSLPPARAPSFLPCKFFQSAERVEEQDRMPRTVSVNSQ
ncbi:hypothetical protein R3P38DRAFT_3216530 [Favolaschia claudopus]|uniref:Uncharacterized protein n=1 Tax=Favolaschia claudopus TaxID=2862362 RepID=A0AAW0A6W8_9AGAR